VKKQVTHRSLLNKTCLALPNLVKPFTDRTHKRSGLDRWRRQESQHACSTRHLETQNVHGAARVRTPSKQAWTARARRTKRLGNCRHTLGRFPATERDVSARGLGNHILHSISHPEKTIRPGLSASGPGPGPGAGKRSPEAGKPGPDAGIPAPGAGIHGSEPGSPDSGPGVVAPGPGPGPGGRKPWH
jgi:hypothetical protein